MSSTRDFTLAKYAELCRALVESAYTPLSIAAYLECSEAERPASFVLLRHDVETSPGHTLRMARLESERGLVATYFFRTKAGAIRPAVIASLRDLGHDIGYHYETVARARGDLRRAIEMFRADLDRLRLHAPVRVASMHGSPLFPWDNRRLWEEARPGDFGLLGEVYLDIDYRDVRYFSDTGRTWHPTRHNLRDHVGAPAEDVVDTTDELIALVRARRHARLCLLAHPERWSASAGAWILRAGRDVLENGIKAALGRAYRPRGGQPA